MKSIKARPGHRFPLGATFEADGANFSMFSRHASRVELLLYETVNSPRPFKILRLDPEINRDFFFWNIFVEGVRPGMAYTWRADGPDDTAVSGFRFNPERQLLDPCARIVFDGFWQREQAKTDPKAEPIRAVIPGPLNGYDWEGVEMPEHAPNRSVIYEMHVGGFTRHSSSGVSNPGTFSGIIQKIPYLKKLGITHVELLPIMAFDEQDVPRGVRELGLKNYWGYSTHSYFSLHPSYLVDPWSDNCLNEFRDMVKELHRAGIGVIMDVVFNHTAEGGEDGPVINFKGLSNREFYHLDPQDRRKYRDFTGCGNTVNCNHPQVTFFIIECLGYWISQFHIDGFRFDLASVMARGEDGNPMHHAPVIWSLEFCHSISSAGLIAEAWDAGGLYQVGGFPGYRWQEWNGRYRDVVRKFVRGDKGLIGEVATRLSGSSDLYQPGGRHPFNSINFVTCHDGFTLNDLVSYAKKHNEANGEQNRDGTNENFSSNYGVEGETRDRKILALRSRQAKNFMALLLLSQGVPMILSGDEVLRTQKGNNNCWCQDNELSWLDWGLTEKNAEMLRFTRRMIAFRRRHACLMRRHFLSGTKKEGKAMPDISWHGIKLLEPPWDDPEAGYLAFTLAGKDPGEEDLHVMINMDPQRELEMELPEAKPGHWFVAIDTFKPSPRDIVQPSRQKPFTGSRYPVRPRSIVVLERREQA